MLKVGDTYEMPFSLTQEQVNAFAELSGDKNPVHIDAAFAANTSFKKPIVHGIFSAAIFSRILGTIFPGDGTIYLGQTLQFKRPVYPGEDYQAKVEVVSLDGRNSATIATVLIHAPTGKAVIEGEAKVMHKELIP
ncbi:MAG: MaoC family dehydratase [Imperialibacter sp.]|uniref:MaoC family dehydratase n=1 Tax=Imperialibacter sp. TaxID=2038411 RepID=UPI0032EF15B1